jgi:hypothetical protein
MTGCVAQDRFLDYFLTFLAGFLKELSLYAVSLQTHHLV